MNTGRALTILQLNDSHAYMEPHQEVFWGPRGLTFRRAGGLSRIATLLSQVRAEQPGRTLFLDGGDTLHGTLPAVRTNGQALVPILNYLAPAAMTAHWEFAAGPEEFRRRAEALRYPVLAANVYDEDSGRRYFAPHVLVEVGGVRVGVVGLASNIVDKTMPPHFSRGVRFTLGRQELPDAIETLRHDEGADLVVLLSHLGYPQDLALLSEVHGVDVCLSGHTHNRVRQPVRCNGALLIQSGSHGSFLGRLDLELQGGRIAEARHRLIDVSEEIPPDPEAEALVREALAPYREELGEVVGETATPLHRGTSLESTMDNLLLAALRDATGAQLAFSNGWRYGAPVVPGPITLNDLYNMVPMDPPVSTVTLTGRELWEMLEENLERTFSRDPFAQMGGYVKRCLGLRAYIRIENPHGQRLQALFVGEEEAQPERRYTAAFITTQGVPQQYGEQRHDHAESIVAVLRDFAARHRPVRVDLHGTFQVV